MWLIAKIKQKNIGIFSNEMKKKLKGLNLYFPKIKNNLKSKNLLGNYIFCYHSYFSNTFEKEKYKNTKGLEYFLNTIDRNQKEIKKFVDNCKKHEDEDGYIKNSFFKNNLNENGKFTYGPFINYLFKTIRKDKNDIIVKIGNFKLKISDNEKALYQLN